MTLHIADYILIVLATVLVVLGGFRGLSGTIALFVALAASVVAARLGWPCAGAYSLPVWAKVALVSAGTLLTFGLVRIIVAKTIKCLLAQPTDAIFGAAAGLVAFLMIVFIWSYLGNRVHADFPAVRDCSTIVRSFSAYVG